MATTGLCATEINFAGKGAAAAAALWAAVDDRVMGGLSQSGLSLDSAAGHAVFRGNVSFDNNGGFASVRTLPSARLPLRAPGAHAYELEVRGDGKKEYKLTLRMDNNADDVSYQASFTPTERWTTVSFPVATAFSARYRGRVVPGAPALDPGLVCQAGLLVSGRQEGPFELHLRFIRACVATPPSL